MVRPIPRIDPAKGLMHAAHFQIAYATNDLAHAKSLMAAHYGIDQWQPLGGPLKAGGSIAIELAWVGGVMLELLTAEGEGSAIYVDRLPPGDGFKLKHHHLGYWLDGDVEWAALMETIARGGHDMPHVSFTEGFMKSCFVDAPALGHYLEYICPDAAGRAFFETVPGN